MSAFEMAVPKVNANDETVELLHWYVKEGASVKKGDDLVDLGTSKANVTLQAEASGFLVHRARAGMILAVGAPLASICETQSECEAIAKASQAPAPVAAGGGSKSAPAQSDFEMTRLSLAAQKYAAEKGIPVEALKGLGLVTEKTLRKLYGASPAAEALVKRSVPVGRIKAIEIESLTLGQAGNINSSVTVQFPSARLFEKLRELNAMNGAILPLILSEFAKLLKQNPAFTAFYSNGAIHYYDQVNLGVAIDMGEGLKVPVIKNAEQLTPGAIYEKMTDFALKYGSGKLSLEDVSDGTVTVTDLSGQNVLNFQPLVNRDQSVILGVGGDFSMEGRPISLTLVFDHRVLTGREAATLLSTLRKRLLQYDFSKLA